MKLIIIVLSIHFSSFSFGSNFILRISDKTVEKSFFENAIFHERVRLIRKLKASGIKVYLVDVKDNNLDALEELKALKGTLYVEVDELRAPNQSGKKKNFFDWSVRNKFSLKNFPSDNLFKYQWGLYNSEDTDIDILEAWKKTKGKNSVVVAVIDTGISLRHPDLKENLWVNTRELYGKEGIDDDKNGYIDDIHGYDFFHRDNRPDDEHGHGSHCSGVIAATHNDKGVAGVTSKSSLMPLKIFSDARSIRMSDITEAIHYAVNNGAHILNNSWGGIGPSKIVLESIKYANYRGSIFVAAAGNYGKDNDEHPFYPSSYDVDNIISVAAYDIKGNPAKFTSYGKRSVDVAGPGVDILSTIERGRYAFSSGTSMAAPHVSGIAALLLSLNDSWLGQPFEKRLLKFNPRKMRDFLIRTSVPTPELEHISVSGGRVNAGKAFKEMLVWFQERNRY